MADADVDVDYDELAGMLEEVMDEGSVSGNESEAAADFAEVRAAAAAARHEAHEADEAEAVDEGQGLAQFLTSSSSSSSEGSESEAEGRAEPEDEEEDLPIEVEPVEERAKRAEGAPEADVGLGLGPPPPPSPPPPAPLEAEAMPAVAAQAVEVVPELARRRRRLFCEGCRPTDSLTACPELGLRIVGLLAGGVFADDAVAPPGRQALGRVWLTFQGRAMQATCVRHGSACKLTPTVRADSNHAQ
ncbi:MAG: hypothetical protein GY772_29675, partial [bacterium]|nr:hypothetical protein [bacterium]